MGLKEWQGPVWTKSIGTLLGLKCPTRRSSPITGQKGWATMEHIYVNPERVLILLTMIL
jgi:hypothetical protein